MLEGGGGGRRQEENAGVSKVPLKKCCLKGLLQGKGKKKSEESKANILLTSVKASLSFCKQKWGTKETFGHICLLCSGAAANLQASAAHKSSLTQG